MPCFTSCLKTALSSAVRILPRRKGALGIAPYVRGNGDEKLHAESLEMALWPIFPAWPAVAELLVRFTAQLGALWEMG